mmetsp:Transcript_67472/g.158300  ORF Transcript_67472/g.158300 Transcript_67472/m.158300 type:complete len:219 (+) Transcript_67472:73-729(+)
MARLRSSFPALLCAALGWCWGISGCFLPGPQSPRFEDLRLQRPSRSGQRASTRTGTSLTGVSLVAGFVAAASARSRARFASASSSSATTNSDEFQKLMGVCYGAAGVAHLFDLLGPNLLPAMAGAPSFQELPLPGQLAALFWCATGPIAFAATRLTSKPFGDASLAFYGLYEIGLAASVTATYPSAGVQGVLNAVQVQLVVLAAYVFTAWKDQQNDST